MAEGGKFGLYRHGELIRGKEWSGGGSPDYNRFRRRRIVRPERESRQRTARLLADSCNAHPSGRRPAHGAPGSPAAIGRCAVSCTAVGAWARWSAGEFELAAQSSGGRELAFAASHAIRHFALLRAHRRQHGIAINAQFGRAPVTFARERSALVASPRSLGVRDAAAAFQGREIMDARTQSQSTLRRALDSKHCVQACAPPQGVPRRWLRARRSARPGCRKSAGA